MQSASARSADSGPEQTGLANVEAALIGTEIGPCLPRRVTLRFPVIMRVGDEIGNAILRGIRSLEHPPDHSSNICAGILVLILRDLGRKPASNRLVVGVADRRKGGAQDRRVGLEGAMDDELVALVLVLLLVKVLVFELIGSGMRVFGCRCRCRHGTRANATESDTSVLTLMKICRGSVDEIEVGGKATKVEEK